MLNIPEVIEELYKQDSIDKNFRVHFPDGELPDINNENIVSESVTFTESLCSQQYLKFGLAEASSITFETVGIDNMLGMTIQCFMEIDASSLSSQDIADIQNMSNLDGELILAEDTGSNLEIFYRIPYGIFKVDSCPRNHGAMAHRKVTAYSTRFNDNILGAFEKWKLQHPNANSTTYKPDVWAIIMESLGDLEELQMNPITQTHYSVYDPDISLFDANGNFYEFHFEVTGLLLDTRTTTISQYPLLYLKGDHVLENNVYTLANFIKEYVQGDDDEVGIPQYINSKTGPDIYEILELPESIDSISDMMKQLFGIYFKPTIIYTGLNGDLYDLSVDPLTFAYPLDLVRKDNNFRTVDSILLNPQYTGCKHIVFVPTEIYSITILCHRIDTNSSRVDTIYNGSAPEYSTPLTEPELYGCILPQYPIPFSVLDYAFKYTKTMENWLGTTVYTFEKCYELMSLLNGYLELAAAFGRIDRNGTFTLTKLAKPTAYNVSKDTYISVWWDEYDVDPIGSITYTYQTPNENGQQTTTYTFNRKAKSIYEMTNNYILRHLRSWNSARSINSWLKTYFIPNIKGINFTPLDLEMKGLPYIEDGDYLTIITEDNVVVSSYVLNHSIRGIQSLQDTIESTNGDLLSNEEVTN